LQLDDPMASREHAQIGVTPQGIAIVDRGSTNGVFVDGIQIRKIGFLRPGSVIRLANTVIVFAVDRLIYNCPSENTGHLAVDILARRVREKTILRNVRFEADPGDFILILGGAGAGKTTLINSILGEVRAEGRIMLGGQNLYDNFKSMKSRIGLVPQFFNLRENDRVYSTLMDIADFKLGGYKKSEKKDRIEKILQMIGISELQNYLIRQLSGGQKKKVAVAAQLVGFQNVFILDEPDSGLDPASRMQQMEILKDIAEAGKIIMVVSHASEEGINFDTGHYRFTKVLVLAKNKVDKCGELAFYGSPEEALQFFGVRRLSDIIIEINPENEGGKGKGDYYIYKYKGRMMV
ncbi:MAG: ATP-binding cassette domain-containing protein, partial [Blautia sp.]|nr:ATP-binding cassette domain-containing protein [Blautia sp.]